MGEGMFSGMGPYDAAVSQPWTAWLWRLRELLIRCLLLQPFTLCVHPSHLPGTAVVDRPCAQSLPLNDDGAIRSLSALRGERSLDSDKPDRRSIAASSLWACSTLSDPVTGE